MSQLSRRQEQEEGKKKPVETKVVHSSRPVTVVKAQTVVLTHDDCVEKGSRRMQGPFPLQVFKMLLQQ